MPFTRDSPINLRRKREALMRLNPKARRDKEREDRKAVERFLKQEYSTNFSQRFLLKMARLKYEKSEIALPPRAEMARYLGKISRYKNVRKSRKDVRALKWTQLTKLPQSAREAGLEYRITYERIDKKRKKELRACWQNVSP